MIIFCELKEGAVCKVVELQMAMVEEKTQHNFSSIYRECDKRDVTRHLIFPRSEMLTRAALCAGRPRTFARTSTPSSLTLRRWKQTASESQNVISPAGDTSATSKEGSVPELSPLSRPLGVEERPSPAPRSWEDKKAELLDYDKHIEKRRHLWVTIY